MAAWVYQYNIEEHILDFRVCVDTVRIFYRLLALASKKFEDSPVTVSVFFASYSSVDRICSKTT